MTTCHDEFKVSKERKYNLMIFRGFNGRLWYLMKCSGILRSKLNVKNLE